MDKHRDVIQKLIQFRNENNCNQFQDSNNLALTITNEAAKLNKRFLWEKDNEAKNIDLHMLSDELVDELPYSFLLAEKHTLDVHEIILEKIKMNGTKYPVTKAKGTVVP